MEAVQQIQTLRGRIHHTYIGLHWLMQKFTLIFLSYEFCFSPPPQDANDSGQWTIFWIGHWWTKLKEQIFFLMTNDAILMEEETILRTLWGWPQKVHSVDSVDSSGLHWGRNHPSTIFKNLKKCKLAPHFWSWWLCSPWVEEPTMNDVINSKIFLWSGDNTSTL